MYQTMEIYTGGKKQFPQRFLLNSYRIFDESVSDIKQDQRPLSHIALCKQPQQHPRSPDRNNMPHPYYAKFLRDNVRFLKEPIHFMDTAEWWPSGQQSLSIDKPPYDRKTTQRSDFQNLAYCKPQKRHDCNPHKTPVHGIAPLVSPKPREKLPKLLLEHVSFKHHYDSRLTPSEPIPGKRHGAFVWTEIKTESQPRVPQGTRPFLNATGSHSLRQAQTEKGNSVESSVTSPNLCEHGSQQMFNSETRLSKTDFRDSAKTYPTIPDGEQSGSSRPTRRNTLIPISEFLASQPSVNRKHKAQ
ncbi:uncharacterized protein C2orf73 homolog isoform X2 [Spea bombifrons]|uniref:uncharacterized protein C2orf73 homolog isoform X2 n=1 Tax=Spea bombifrons TaxID=233779 RepID=UPI00234A8127|nr:uncharacterized protein C2orf73 homolog isoform X2 [Spea bombifrons]